jgi:hypothetical protein
VWLPEQIEQWRLRQRAYTSDATSVVLYQNLDQRRSAVQQEMTQLLHSFLQGEISVKAFNASFQQKCRWNGMSLGYEEHLEECFSICW